MTAHVKLCMFTKILVIYFCIGCNMYGKYGVTSVVCVYIDVCVYVCAYVCVCEGGGVIDMVFECICLCVCICICMHMSVYLFVCMSATARVCGRLDG